MVTPLGRIQDQPEDPTEDLSPTPFAMAAGDKVYDGNTIASKKDSFFKRGDPELNSPDAAGPKGPITMPGGNPMISGYMPGKGDGMQYSSEGGQQYKGSDNYGKIIHKAKTSDLGEIYE